MTTLTLPDELVERIQEIAQREGRPVEIVVADMVDHYPPPIETPVEDEVTPKRDPLLGLVGLLDEFTDATDLSSTIRETLKEHTHPKYGWTKRGRTD